MADLRRQAAVELYKVCRGFVTSVNALTSEPFMNLDPPEFSGGHFLEDAQNLFQINVRGRILQVEFESAGQLASTENFRVPYTLQGATRCFNQDLLDHEIIEEELLFYCLEVPRPMWRFFDARTYRSGSFDRDYLVQLMERLV